MILLCKRLKKKDLFSFYKCWFTFPDCQRYWGSGQKNFFEWNIKCHISPTVEFKRNVSVGYYHHQKVFDTVGYQTKPWRGPQINANFPPLIRTENDKITCKEMEEMRFGNFFSCVWEAAEFFETNSDWHESNFCSLAQVFILNLEDFWQICWILQRGSKWGNGNLLQGDKAKIEKKHH